MRDVGQPLSLKIIDASNVLIAELIAGLVAMNIVAMLKAHSSSFYERKQKSIQYVLIWLATVLGAILLWVGPTE